MANDSGSAFWLPGVARKPPKLNEWTHLKLESETGIGQSAQGWALYAVAPLFILFVLWVERRRVRRETTV